jgi:hypothetical protein
MLFTQKKYCGMMAEVEPKETTIARQRNDKLVSAATNEHTTTEELLKTVFSAGSAPEVI